MPAPGLFQERSKTNFFNGIWKMAVDEVERPGSFQAHMYRSLVLLIKVLIKQNDCSMLLFCAQQLHRPPEKDKKFLKDADRLALTKWAVNSIFDIAKDKLDNVVKVGRPNDKIKFLLEVYKSWQASQKLEVDPLKANMCLLKTFNQCVPEHVNASLEKSKDPLDKISRYCQQQQMLMTPMAAAVGGGRSVIH